METSTILQELLTEPPQEVSDIAYTITVRDLGNKLMYYTGYSQGSLPIMSYHRSDASVMTKEDAVDLLYDCSGMFDMLLEPEVSPIHFNRNF